jgi:hypothetical protein
MKGSRYHDLLSEKDIEISKIKTQLKFILASFRILMD